MDSKKYKIIRLGAVCAGFLLVIVVCNIFLTIEAKKILKTAFAKEISQKTNGLYQLTFGAVEVNLLTAVAEVKNVKLQMDPKRFRELSTMDSLPPIYGSIDIQSVELEGVYLLFHNEKEHLEPRHIKINQLQVDIHDNPYTLNVEQIEFSPKDTLLEVKNLKYATNIPKGVFTEKDKNHASWMDIAVGDVRLQGVSVFQKMYAAERLQISDATFQNYKNQKIPIEHHDMPMVHDVIQRLPLKLAVRDLQVTNLNIIYEELAENGEMPGRITFNNMNAQATNFTNVPASIAQMNRLTVSGKLMNEGLIQATINLPVDSLYDCFTIVGTLGTMDAVALNAIIEPLAPLKINRGFIQGLDFNIEGNSVKADISMCLRYNDLGVKILFPIGGQNVDAGLLSSLVTGLIPQNYPLSNTECQVQAEYVRNALHSPFYYLWHIYFEGVKETAGFTPELQERVEWALSLKHEKK